MDVRDLSRSVHDQLAAAAAVGDESTRRAAQLLGVAVDPAVRLALQDAISQVAAEVSAGIAPSRVDLALHGTDLEVRVVPPVEDSSSQGGGAGSIPGTGALPGPGSVPEADAAPGPGSSDERAAAADPEADGTAARVSFRPPQHLKDRLEKAAAEEGLSMNAYLVRVLGAHLDGTCPGAERPAAAHPRSGRVSGWFI